MSFPLRRLLRDLRLVVACLVLGLIASPPVCAAASAACRGDAVVWVAAASVADDAGGDESSPASMARAARAPDDAPSGERTGHVDRLAVAVPRRPAASRTVVVRERLYLRHAALLC